MYKLSIIVPVYNVSEYIDECIQSIISELKSNMELILINDGSKDDSLEKCEKYRDRNVKIINQENHGVSYTRNKGIKESSAEYIMFVDADDVLISNWSNIIEALLNDSFDVLYLSKQLNEEFMDKKNIIYGILGKESDCGLSNLASPCSKLYKRSFLIQERILFNESLINGEDALFNLNVILSANKITCHKESIYKYRIRYSSSSKTFNEKFFESNFIFLKNAETLMKDSGILTSEEIDELINFSYSYSIYLYIFLISRINDKSNQKKVLYTLDSKIIKEYFARFKTTNHLKKSVTCIYNLVKSDNYKLALMTMKIINNFRSIKNIVRKHKVLYYFIDI